MKTTFASLLIFLYFYTFSANAQNDSVFSYTLPAVNILQNDNGKDVVYEFEKNYNSFLLTDSFLVADVNKFSYKVNINDLKKITKVRKNTSAPAVMSASFGFGFLLGAMLAGMNFGGGSSVDGTQRVLVGLGTGTVFALIGGSITALSSHDNSYGVYDRSFKERKTRIKEILNKIKK